MDILLAPHPIPKQTSLVDGRTEEIWPLPLDRNYLRALFTELFEQHWDKLSWGPLIPGAAYELNCPDVPERISFSDLDYLTKHFRKLEDENRHLRDLIAALQRDRADYLDFIRQESQRCSKP